MLTTQFEELRMQEDENIVVFISKLRHIANKVFQLGEIYYEEKLVRKTPRSLPMRFSVEIAAIEEAKDDAKMTLDDLLGSLQTYKMSLNAQTKDKGIILKAYVNGSDSVPYTKDEK